MGNSQSIKKVNYEDMQMIIKTPEIYLLINTLSSDNQECLILNTIPIDKEEAIINKYIKENQKINIIIYGKNCNDQLVDKKYQQLILLGYVNVFIYSGGLFEWLLLQDIFGKDLFLTNKKEMDILKYKPPSKLNISLIEN